MKRLLILLIFCAASLKAAETPEAAFKRLQEGNDRFVKERLLHPDRTHERRLSLAQGQSPFAVIVSCSDSRVVPEVIFDEGLGDLFVIRVAGNVVGSTELESVEYAVGHLDPSIVVVMGHEKCGAVDAVVSGQTQGIPYIAQLIEPAVKQARSLHPADLLRSSIEFNALRMSQLLLKSATLNKKIQSKTIAVHSAYYNLQTGRVEFLDVSQQKKRSSPSGVAW